MSPSCIMVAASVSCGNGNTTDATTGAKQRPAATATGGHRHDRPLQRQPHGTRTIANQLQSAHCATGTVDGLQQSQQQQLKQALEQQTTPLLTVSSLMVTNLTTSHSIPITSADHSPLCMRNKRFMSWGSTRTALSTLFRDNMSQLRKQRKHKKS